MPITKSTLLAGVIAIAFSSASLATVQPLQKNGSCPSRYSPSGAYCAPQPGATHALPKEGSCPTGYRPSGNYCVANSESSDLAIPKHGSCPTGFRPSGKYCLANK